MGDAHNHSGADAGARQGAITHLARGAVRRGAAAIGSRIDDHSLSFRAHLCRGLTVFVFHEVTATPSEFQRVSQGYVSPEVFRKQIDWIGERFDFVAPTALPRLGGRGRLSPRAALITFDDAWAGVFRVALPMLGSLDIPALCFLNMATVGGTPDLSAVRRYERLHAPPAGSRLDRRLDASDADAVLQEISAVYDDDDDYARFQGPTATSDDLDAIHTRWNTVWFGSHLFHHWDIHRISRDLLARSERANAHALAPYGNSLPALSIPYGHELGPAGSAEAREPSHVQGDRRAEPGSGRAGPRSPHARTRAVGTSRMVVLGAPSENLRVAGGLA